SACQAGYKGMWSAEEGYPSRAFLRALDPRLEHLVAEKLSAEISPIGARAGGLTPAMAARLGLRSGTPVGVAIIDAHAAVPAAAIVEPGRVLLILGTSACHLRLRAGQSGLLALDWWNGNRSVLMDADLSGTIVGLTLDTRAEEIYRALIEASAFGTREILENFERHDHRVRELIGCGGIAEKNAT